MTSSDEIAICVNGLSKCYRIFERPQDRLKQSIVARLCRLLGRIPPAYYREFWALRDVSFEVRKGETVGIIGRNGAGKSTLLQILCGTLHPTTGQVAIRGKVAALLELGSGFNAEFSGRENVYLYANLLGLLRDEIDARLPMILEFAGIGDFIDMPIKTYSTGMVVRLAFSVIAHMDADILIIDEALAVGDAFFVQKCMRFLRAFMEKGTVLFVSHSTAAVTNLCNRAVWLHSGAVKGISSPKEISEQYLADLYEEQQGPGTAPRTARTNPGIDASGCSEWRDQRLDLLNGSQFRNDLELFHFDPDNPGFGAAGVAIVNVQIEDLNRNRLGWSVGGERVVIRIRCEAHRDVSSPIIGFFVKDRLGQCLFGDNTFLTYLRDPLRVRTGEQFEACFTFSMPILPAGNYSVCVAVAEGTQNEHVMHHWIHDAFFFKSHSSSVSSGLVGIPMQEIRLNVS